MHLSWALAATPAATLLAPYSNVAGPLLSLAVAIFLTGPKKLNTVAPHQETPS
jgi:hypothetical protein